VSLQVTSTKGILALIVHEGVVPGYYLDSRKIPTWGIGHTAAAGYPNPKDMGRGMPANLDQALQQVFQVFVKDLAKYEADVRAAVKTPLAQHEFDALVSFHYNTGAIARATLTKHLNAGEKRKAGEAFLNWLKPAEIADRRKAEQKLFLTGEYPKGEAIVWGVTVGGQVIWKPQRKLNQHQILHLMGREDPVAALGFSTLEPAQNTGLLGWFLEKVFGLTVTKQGAK
jgi:lysozyme